MVPERRWRPILDLADAQGGPVAVRQIVAHGIPRSSIQDRLAGERWYRPFRGVAIPPGYPVDAGCRARAAALAIGTHAAISGQTALLLHGVVDQPSLRPHLVVPPEHRLPTIPDLRVTRSTTLHDDDTRLDRGVLVATVPRAFLDAAARTGTDRLRTWLVDGRQRRIVDLAEVIARAQANPRAPGRGRLLDACRQVVDSGADSALVVEVERRLRSLGFDLDVPPRVVPVPGRVLHPDLTIRGLPVAIEADGFGAHASRRGLDLDQRKHNAYTLAGWVVLRIGWDRLREDWEGFVTELHQAVAAVTAGT